MYYRKLAIALALVMVVGLVSLVSGKVETDERDSKHLQTIEPLDLAVLIQDDLISQVGNELGVTREFIRSLPQGSRVMVGYITAGSLQVRQPFTNDLNRAAQSLRIPVSSTAASPYSPYVEVIEALRSFNSNL